MSKKDDRYEKCIFCSVIGIKCTCLIKTACTDDKRSKCTFYKTERQFLDGQAKSKQILKEKGLKVVVTDNVVTTYKSLK